MKLSQPSGPVDLKGWWPGAGALTIALLACLILPWLSPLSGGPSVSVEPWLVSAVCVAIALALQQQVRLPLEPGLALAALAAWTLIRSGLSSDTVALAAACLVIFLAACVGAAGANRRELVPTIALAWLAAAAISTGMAWVQYFGQADQFAPWIGATELGEAFANLRQRNQFASLTVLGMASLLWLAPNRIGRWPALAAMFWLATGNAATTSRTGLMQMLVLALLSCAWPGSRRDRATMWLAGLVAYAMAAVLLPTVLEATTGATGNRLWDRVAAIESCASRSVLWSNVLHLIAQRPWLGWGWGELDYAHFATLYDGPRFCDILDNAHNLPLHLAVELGIPAALLTCGVLVWAVMRARPWSESDPARQMAWAALALLAIHSLLEYPLWYGVFQMTFGLCLGLLWPAPRHGTETPQEGSGAVAGPRLLAAALIAACIYAAWDYRRVSQIYLAPEARAPEFREDPLPKIRGSWLFRTQAQFAELTITPLTRDNAAWTFESARALLHFSPEPRVVEKLIESATVLGRENEMLMDLARFRAAFPQAYATWSRSRSGDAPPAAQSQPAR